MHLQQRAIPGYWYSNQSGQLIQVRAILFTSGRCSHVVMEDIHGARDYVAVADWAGMDLMLHSPVVEKRQAARDF